MKNILKLLLILILIGGFGWFLFWLLNPSGGQGQDNLIGHVRNFFPFGQPTEDPSLTNTPSNSGESGTKEESPVIRNVDAPLPVIEQIYARPVAGFALVGTSTPIVRLVDRATGHIVDVNTTSKQVTRISNTTLPGIREAIWFGSGSGVIMRYTENNSSIIQTLIVTNLGKGLDTTAGTYAEENILDIKPISPTELAYIVANGFGSFVKIYNVNTQSTQTILQSPVQSWKILAGTSGVLYLQNKASNFLPGYLYTLSRKTGELTKVTGGVLGFNGLLANNTDKVLSTSGGENSYLSIMDLKNGARTFVDLQTVANKCIFQSDTRVLCGIPTSFPSTMPDSWYMGVSMLTDQLWEIDTETGTYTFVQSLSGTDMTHPTLSSDVDHLVFINKKDNSVWIVRLSEAEGVESIN